MEGKKKILIAVVVILIIGGAVVFQMNDSNLFKGQLGLMQKEGTEVEEVEEVPEVQEKKLPNLKASLKVIPPKGDSEDITLDATIENLGPGKVTGETPYTYSLFLNDIEIFTNTDSYTTMEAGDAISFEYPVSKALFEYPDKGTATLIIDTKNEIKEVEKGNNKVIVQYSL